MEKASMTALVSAFSRMFHARQAGVKVFDDTAAELLVSPEEYAGISKSMAEGIHFFNPGFTGGEAAALLWVVNHQLAPSPLGRAAFAEGALEAAVRAGAAQYLIFAAGLDSFSLRRPDWARMIRIYEIDRPAMAAERARRMAASGATASAGTCSVAADLTRSDWTDALRHAPGYDSGAVSFASVLGLSYYIGADALEALLKGLRGMVAAGSRLAMDLPERQGFSESAGEQSGRQALLARAAGEEMQAGMRAEEIQALLARTGWRCAELLTPEESTERYFSDYNRAHPGDEMQAFAHTFYLLAEAV